MYTALHLTQESHDLLAARFRDRVPAGWTVVCDHVTLIGPPQFGKVFLPLPPRGVPYQIFVVSFAHDDLGMAVGVETNVPSLNFQKHITVAVNELMGGTAYHSNFLLNWKPIEGMVLQGYIQDLQE